MANREYRPSNPIVFPQGSAFSVLQETDPVKRLWIRTSQLIPICASGHGVTLLRQKDVGKKQLPAS
jgi:hypothetical protein